MTAESILTKDQKKSFTRIHENELVKVDIRYDDQCNNGHNTFAITGSVYEKGRDGRWLKEPSTCGCIHETIEKVFPEYALYIKWHLCSSDGPMYYVENTCFHAGNRDCFGKEKGVPYNFVRKLMVNDSPFLYEPSEVLLKFIDEVGMDYPWADAELIAVHHDKEKSFKPHYQFAQMFALQWHQCPFSSWDEACNFVHAMSNCKVELVQRATSYGEGKERDLDAARATAVWPDASDEILCLPKELLKIELLKRLPNLIAEFKMDMESLGFVF